MIQMTGYVDPAFDHVSPKSIFTVDKKGHKNPVSCRKLRCCTTKSSEASEFKFPWIEESILYGRFILLNVFNQ